MLKFGQVFVRSLFNLSASLTISAFFIGVSDRCRFNFSPLLNRFIFYKTEISPVDVSSFDSFVLNTVP